MTMTMEPEALAGEAAVSAELTPLADRARTLLDKAETAITATGPHGPGLHALVDELAELAVAFRGVASREIAVDATRTAISTSLLTQVARLFATEGFTASQIRSAAGDPELRLRLADAVEALETTVPEMAE